MRATSQSRHLSLVSLVVVATCLIAAPLAAQRAGSVELAAYGAWPFWDSSLEWEDKVGFGGQLSVFVASNVSLDLDVSRFETSEIATALPDSFSVMPLRARLTLHVPIGGHSRLLLGAGYVNTRLGEPIESSESGATALAGLNIGLGSHATLHMEGTLDLHPSALNEDVTADDFNYGVRAGLGVIFGRSGSKDKDGDGVGDSLDRCADTPKGAVVDGNGCPDRDKDGVHDDVDRCPDTPAGARIDASGCPIKDSDADGISDDVDQCADTPAGAAVTANGCPQIGDADNDGVSDDKDRCSDSPAGVAVDAAGCAIDSDGDGVTDAADKCPNSVPGEAVDGTGCAIVDSDGDGVADKLDRCPDTPSPLVVGADGCLIVFVEGKTNVILEGVTFVAGRAELTIDAKKILGFVAQSLNVNTDVTFEIQGHASSDGADAYNMRLSARRAAAVRTYLISQGVAASRMTSKGYGETMPIADNKTVEGRKQNRRVELVRTAKM